MIVRESISSRQNSKIKQLILLQKSRNRHLDGLFVIEGLKEIEKANFSGYHFKSLFFCPQIISADKVAQFISGQSDCQIFEVTRDVYEKIAYRENTGGIVVLAKMKEQLASFEVVENPLYLVIEGVEKPGNLGAIYRTADAVGVDAVIICDPKADIYNPNAIRASLGCVFTVPTFITTVAEAIALLKANGVQVVTTYLKAAVPYDQVDYKQPTAIVMGTEATGISDEWLAASDFHIIIPMRGAADSMNVSVSTAVVVFEARRQRGF